MLSAIDRAEQVILFEMYLFGSGHLAERFISALSRASSRGVKVYLLLDDFGAMGLHAQDRHRLRVSGVQVAFYNPLRLGHLSANLRRDHRKLLLVDGKLGFTGGSGITDEFDPQSAHPWWHDLMIQMHGPVLADWQRLFAETWSSTGKAGPPIIGGLDHDPAGPHTTQLVINNGRRRDIQRGLLRRLSNANQRIHISVAYFVPPFRIRLALRRAAMRGVDVCLLFPGHYTDHQAVRYAGRRFYHHLLRAGVKIYEYAPRFTHVKLFICDDWVSLGSANLDHWTLHWNLEANLEVYGTPFAQEALRVFSQDQAQARQVTLDAWRARSRGSRIREWFWSLISDWLLRWEGVRAANPWRRARLAGRRRWL